MAEIIYNAKLNEWEYRQMLRSPYIDYFNGRFFITFQVYHNKSIFGAIIGDECVLNELGELVKTAWLNEPQHVNGLTLDEFVVMPNHFHAIVEYHATESAGRGGPAATCGDRATAPGRYFRDPHARDLPYVVGLFKSYTTHLYQQLKAAGKCPDIGAKLWQESFYDELIKSEQQYRNTVRYIKRNPANWNSDRFGAVTTFSEGNIGLLQSDYVAYLSSEGYIDGEAMPFHRVDRAGAAAQDLLGAVAQDLLGAVAQDLLGAVAQQPREATGPLRPVATGSLRPVATGSLRPVATGPLRPVVSTFTSYYERKLLDRCLASGRRIIWVCPGGIGEAALAKTATARANGLALLISPVAPGTGVNKQRANWCNQFIVKNAVEIWIGHIRPGGSLETILNAVRGD